jgi:hypothetical protein
VGQDSVDAYERAFSLADRLDAEKSAPLNYSACLRDYADALEQAGDKPRAEQKRAKAEVIQKQSPSPDILYYPKKPALALVVFFCFDQRWRSEPQNTDVVRWVLASR